MKNKFDIAKLEEYLDGKLSPEETRELREEMDKDSNLSSELRALALSREAVEMAGWKKLIQQSQTEYLADRNIKSIENTPLEKPNWYLRIAASLAIILVGMAALLVLTTTPQGMTEDFLSYQVPIMRGAEEPITSIKSAFQNQEFLKVIELAEKASALDIDAKFLVGMAYLETENGDKAIEELLAIQRMNDSSEVKMYQEEIDYYLLRAYLSNGNFDLAQNQLEAIRSNPKHKYQRNIDRWDALKIRILDLKY
jgi:hypothetical protein